MAAKSLSPEELNALWELHLETEFKEKSADHAVETMVCSPDDHPMDKKLSHHLHLIIKMLYQSTLNACP